MAWMSKAKDKTPVVQIGRSDLDHAQSSGLSKSVLKLAKDKLLSKQPWLENGRATTPTAIQVTPSME